MFSTVFFAVLWTIIWLLKLVSLDIKTVRSHLISFFCPCWYFPLFSLLSHPIAHDSTWGRSFPTRICPNEFPILILPLLLCSRLSAFVFSFSPPPLLLSLRPPSLPFFVYFCTLPASSCPSPPWIATVDSLGKLSVSQSRILETPLLACACPFGVPIPLVTAWI